MLFGARQVLEMLHGKFQGDFHGGGAVVGEKHVRQFGRRPFAQARGQLLRGIVREARQNHLLEFAGLFRNRSADARVAVAVQIHPPGRNGVQDAAPIGQVKVDAFRAGHMERGGVQESIRKRVPDAQWCVHWEKAERSKWFRNTCISAVRWRFGSLGISPITRTCPNFSMVSRFSRFCSPINTTPCTGNSAACSAASVNNVWLTVPTLLRAARITGSLNFTIMSSMNCLALMGTSTPPAPSTISQSFIRLVGRFSRLSSISTPAQRAARSGDTGGTNL